MNLHEFRGIVRQTLLVPVLLLLLLAAFVLWQISRSSAALRWLDHSDQITTSTVELEKLIIDQETGLRGYQLTGDPAMLAPYRAATDRIAKHFNQLHDYLSDNPAQLGNLARVRDNYQIWLGFAQGVLNRGTATQNDLQLNHDGKQLMDNVRAAADAVLQSERGLRKQHSATALSLEHDELIAILVSTLVVGVLLGIFTTSRLRLVSRTYDATLEEVEKQAEELYESRQWFQTTLESIGDAVIACDIDGRIKFMNAVALELTEWTMQDAMDLPLQNVFQIIHEETREIAENPVDKVRRLKKVIGLANHTALISKQGKEFVIDDSAAPIRDQDGEMTGIVLVFRDVTEVKRTEAALISGEKLAVAGRLAASIAHEIHNPLDSVANLHYLLADEPNPAKRAEYLHLAQQELGRTMQISRTLLSLYREPKAPVVLDLKELIDGVLLLLERRLAQQDINVDRNFSEGYLVEGFPAELRQVFTNIIVNALDAAGKEGLIRITMEHVSSEELHGTGVLVEITDSGSGFDDEVHQNLFQPFFTTKGENGTGLGLWVSMGIVQKHGGIIRMVNCDDGDLKGACVRVYLPTRTLASAANRTTAHVRTNQTTG